MNNNDILVELRRIADALERSAVLTASVEEQLRKMTTPKHQEVLGFTETPKPQYLYIGGDNQDYCWYHLVDDKQIPIQESAIAGRITCLSLIDRQYKNDSRTKLDIRLSADREYVIRTGLDSIAAKCLLLSLWKLSPQALQEVLTISLRRGTTETKVVFAEVYQGRSRVNYEWEEFNALATAIALSERINGGFH